MARAQTESGSISKSAAAKGGGSKPNPLVPFLANFLQSKQYKPTQGQTMRWLTAGGIALILGTGVLRVYDLYLQDQGPWTAYGVAGLLLALVAWFAFRVVHYPPFGEFLIATEAEMNKVSWTSKEDLIRATIVVLVTVAIMATYLFLVDKLWVFLLELIGVLRMRSGGFGSQAG
jgi:preprotein translocase subunit SecE